MSKRETQFAATSASSLRRVYLFALCVFGLGLFGVYSSSYQESASERSFDTIINLSGRQRMLSQRLGVLANRLMSRDMQQDEELEKEIRAALDSFVNVHKALKTGDIALGLSGLHSEESLQLYEQIDPFFEELVSNISHLLNEKDVQGRPLSFRRGMDASESFLPLMDSLVFRLTEEAQELSRAYDRIQKSLLLSLFLLLAVSAFTLFEPLVRRLKAFRDAQEAVLERLRQSEGRFALAVAGSNDGLWDWDIESGEMYSSDRMIELLGYQPEQFPQRFETWATILHPDDYGPIMARVEHHLRDGAPFDVECRCK